MNRHIHSARCLGAGNACGVRLLCVVATGTIIAMAGMRDAIAQPPGATPGTPVPAADLKTPPSPGPLRGTMRLNPSKFGARAASAPSVSVETIQDACAAIDKNRYAQALRAIRSKESLCAAASYSVDEQRAAGCDGADTVDRCQLKLYNFCMDRAGDRAAFRSAANQELAAVRRVRDMLDAQLRYIENTLAQHGGEVGGRPSPPRLPRLETVPIK